MKIKFLVLLLSCCWGYASGQLYAPEEFAIMAEEDGFPLRIKLQDRLAQEGNLEIDIYTNALDGAGAISQQVLIPIIKDYPNQMELKVHYLAEEVAPGVFESYNGMAEVEEMRRQLAIKQLYPDKYLDYIQLRVNKVFVEEWQTAAQALELNLDMF